MNILVVSPEAGNWNTASSLATAVNRLTDAFASVGSTVLTCSPFFKNRLIDIDSYSCVFTGIESLFGKPYEIWTSKNDPLHTYIYNEEYFNRPYIYGPPQSVPYQDNHIRFAFLSSATLAYASAINFKCQAIFGHEWGGALIGALARTTYSDYAINIPFFFAVHNILYDFHISSSEIPKIGLPPKDYNMDGYEFWGKVSLLKVGILYSTKVLFPSPGYCSAMLNSNLPGGLSGFLNHNADKLIGIQFGVSYKVWDFNEIENLPIKQAKLNARLNLQQQLGVNFNDKMIVYVHLDNEAGNTAEILATILSDITQLDVFIVVGISSTNEDWNYFYDFAQRYSDSMCLQDLGDECENVAQLRGTLAGVDAIFAAKLSEPSCSIILKAMACGAIPITGRNVGIASLLINYTLKTAGEANAFLVENANAPHEMLRCTKDAVNVYKTEIADWDKCVINVYSGFHYEWCRTVSKYLLIFGELGL